MTFYDVTFTVMYEAEDEEQAGEIADLLEDELRASGHTPQLVKHTDPVRSGDGWQSVLIDQ